MTNVRRIRAEVLHRSSAASGKFSADVYLCYLVQIQPDVGSPFGFRFPLPPTDLHRPLQDVDSCRL